MSDLSTLQSTLHNKLAAVSTGVKLIVVCVLALLMTIPAFFVNGLVSALRCTSRLRASTPDASIAKNVFFSCSTCAGPQTGIERGSIAPRKLVSQSVQMRPDKVSEWPPLSKCLAASQAELEKDCSASPGGWK
ncbi:MAG: hypothetical protein ACLGXA_18595 [Acidobacteriota bacterium]